MEDRAIIDLYWSRDPEAIRRTGEKYGNYCRAVARRILPDRRDAEECVNDTWLGPWNPTFWPNIWGKSQEIWLSASGGPAGRRNGAEANYPWSWMNWRSAFHPPIRSRP